MRPARCQPDYGSGRRTPAAAPLAAGLQELAERVSSPVLQTGGLQGALWTVQSCPMLAAVTAVWGSACWGAAPQLREAVAGSPAAAAAAFERCVAEAQVRARCPVPASTVACLRGCWAARLPLPMPHDHPPALPAEHADHHLCRAAPQAAAHCARHSSGPTAAVVGHAGERQVWHCSAGLRRTDFGMMRFACHLQGCVTLQAGHACSSHATHGLLQHALTLLGESRLRHPGLVLQTERSAQRASSASGTPATSSRACLETQT